MGAGGSKRRDGSSSKDGAPAKKAKRSAIPAALKSGQLHFEIQSDYSAGRDVQTAILDELARSGFSSHSTFAVKLALEEAMINAIKHGNKMDRKKKVIIDATITTATAEIVIQDEGPGFQRSSVPDPTEDDNIEKCSGRGILLMESYMNNVSWSNGGRKVRMIKHNEADTLPRRKAE